MTHVDHVVQLVLLTQLISSRSSVSFDSSRSSSLKVSFTHTDQLVLLSKLEQVFFNQFNQVVLLTQVNQVHQVVILTPVDQVVQVFKWCLLT